MRSAPELAATYRPHLDGVRAVAVYLVVLFHAGVGRLSGGYVGVDVFFVLSGYLVTLVLVRDLDATGTVRLSRFYARRVRRLLPAATVVLLTTAVVVTVMRPPATWLDAESAIRAAALYVSNWFFVARSTDYFATDIAANPVLHFWSLSVEEQFYLVWPVVVLGLVRLTGARGSGRRSRRLLQGSIAALAVCSAAAALHLATDQLARAYYGTDTRAYQLLAGALLALSPGLLARLRAGRGRSLLSVGSAAGVVVLVVLATSLVSLGPISRGMAVAVTTVAVLAALESAPGGLGARWLSAPPLAYLGRISYGTYLWHWIVVLALDEETSLEPVPIALVTMVVATAIAALSYHVLEHPIRAATSLDRHRGPVLAGGIALSLVVGLGLTPLVFDRAERDATGVSEVDWQAAREDFDRPPECTRATLADCRAVEGGPPRVLLIGDSHAAMFVPMVSEVARRQGWELSVASMPACSWIDGVRSALFGKACERSQAEWYGPVIEAIDPDLVVLSHRALDDPESPVKVYGEGTRFLEAGNPALDRLLAERTQATVESLLEDGRRVVILEPVPQPPAAYPDPIDCLSEPGDPARCGFDAADGPSDTERVHRRLAETQPEVWALNIDGLVCPALPRCDAVVDDTVVRRDPDHLTRAFAVRLAPAFEDLLRSEGIVPPP